MHMGKGGFYVVTCMAIIIYTIDHEHTCMHACTGTCMVATHYSILITMQKFDPSHIHVRGACMDIVPTIIFYILLGTPLPIGMLLRAYPFPPAFLRLLA